MNVNQASFVDRAWRIFCMFYFLLTISLLGFVLAWGFCVPIYFLARLFPRLESAGDFVFQRGIQLLMALQFWLPFERQKQKESLFWAQGPAIFMMNHRSTLDVFLILASIRGIKIFAKSSLFRFPFLGVTMWATGMIPAKRGDLKSLEKASLKMKAMLAQGKKILIFPEMTRCEEGFVGLQNMALFPFKLAIDSSVPVVPLAVIGSDHSWPKGSFSVRSGQRCVLVEALPLKAKGNEKSPDLRRGVSAAIREAMSLAQ